MKLEFRLFRSIASSGTATSDNSITRVTPTSSDQRIDVDYEQDHDHSQDMVTDHDEEVIVDNTDDEECIKRSRQTTLTALGSHPCNGNPGMGAGRDEKNRFVISVVVFLLSTK